MISVFCVAVFSGTTVGCATSPMNGGHQWVRTELYFGLAKPGGAVVSDEEWKNFVDTEVISRFPNGFTELQAHGRYRGRDQTLFDEPSRVLVILHPRPAGNADRKINEICDRFARRFDQESVLRTNSPADVSFVVLPPRESAAASATRPTLEKAR